MAELKPSSLAAARTAAAIVAAAVLLVGPSACGSDSDRSASTQSPAVTNREAGGAFSLGTYLKVVNKTGADLQVTICGNGNCKAARVLKVDEWEDMAASDVNGWVKYNYDVSPDGRSNPPLGGDEPRPGEGRRPGDEWPPVQRSPGEYTSFTHPFQIDFRAGNPDVGQPWIELTTSKQTCDSGRISYGERFPGDFDSKTMKLGVDEKQQSDNLCSYKLVGSRAADGEDYKMLTLTAYPKGWSIDNVGFASG